MDASGLSKPLWFDFFTDFRDVFGSWSRISDFDPVYPILFRCQKCVDRSRRSPARNIADVFQTTPRPRFRNRKRRLEDRAFRARRPGGCPSLRTGRVIRSVTVSIPCSSVFFFACFQMKNKLDYITVNPHLMVYGSPPYEKANKTDKGSLVIAKSIREVRRRDC